jgi:hypothetical protein
MTVYLLHPVGAPTPEGVKANLARAKRWAAWLMKSRPNDTILASWMLYVECLEDSNLAERRRGIRDSCRVIRSGFVTEVVAAGGRISPGMEEEITVATEAKVKITDLSELGEEPPEVKP